MRLRNPILPSIDTICLNRRVGNAFSRSISLSMEFDCQPKQFARFFPASATLLSSLFTTLEKVVGIEDRRGGTRDTMVADGNIRFV